MQSLHHITIGSYYVDGLPADPVGHKRADRKTAIGIYAADKPFSKGGKLTLRASIPARLNNHDMPTLKEAKAILMGASVEESDAWRDPAYCMIFVRQALRLQSAAVANGCTEEEAARGYTFKEVRGDYVATVRKSSGNRGLFWLATLTHKGARIENDLRYNGAEQAQALAVAWLNKHSPLPAAPATLSTDESAPRSDSAVVNMLLAQRVAAAAKPAPSLDALDCVGFAGQPMRAALQTVVDMAAESRKRYADTKEWTSRPSHSCETIRVPVALLKRIAEIGDAMAEQV